MTVTFTGSCAPPSKLDVFETTDQIYYLGYNVETYDMKQQLTSSNALFPSSCPLTFTYEASLNGNLEFIQHDIINLTDQGVFTFYQNNDREPSGTYLIKVTITAGENGQFISTEV